MSAQLQFDATTETKAVSPEQRTQARFNLADYIREFLDSYSGAADAPAYESQHTMFEALEHAMTAHIGRPLNATEQTSLMLAFTFELARRENAQAAS